MKTLKNLEVKSLFFIIVLILVTIGAFRIFLPYLNIIIVSLVIVQIFYPIYQGIYKKTKSAAFSTAISVLTTLIFVIVPIILLILLILGEVRNITETSNIIGDLGNLQESVNNFVSSINTLLSSNSIDLRVAQVDLSDVVIQGADSVRAQILPVAQQILTLSGEILFNIFLLILCLSYLFPLYEKLPNIFSKISPLDKKLDLILFHNFQDTTKGVIKGSFFVALVQATAVLIPLLLLHVNAPILLWIIMVILSVLPVGSGLVWGPIGFIMIIEGARTGNTGQIILAIALIVYSAIIINVIDTTLRPRIMKNSINIHPLVTIFSVLGGLSLFGPIGILYGPIIVVFFISIIEIYNKQYLINEDASESV